MKRQRTPNQRRTNITPLLVGGLIAITAIVFAACGGGSDTTGAGYGMAAMDTAAGAGGTGATASTPVATDTVQIDDFAFSPATVTVAAGSTVVWTNDDSIQHDVAFDGGGIASRTLGHNDTFSYTFPTAGTYPYICSIHPFMHGTVIVTA